MYTFNIKINHWLRPVDIKAGLKSEVIEAFDVLNRTVFSNETVEVEAFEYRGIPIKNLHGCQLSAEDIYVLTYALKHNTLAPNLNCMLAKIHVFENQQGEAPTSIDSILKCPTYSILDVLHVETEAEAKEKHFAKAFKIIQDAMQSNSYLAQFQSHLKEDEVRHTYFQDVSYKHLGDNIVIVKNEKV